MRCRIWVVFVLASAAPMGGVWGFDQADLEAFRKNGSCPACDLSGAELRLEADGSEGIPAGARDLRGANLQGAWIRGRYLLRESNLRGADLSDSRATYVSFEGADLSGARLTGMVTYGTKFDNAVLRGANLSRTRFDAWFSGADLAGADISGSNFSELAHFTQEQIDRACGNADTVLPADLEVRTCK